MSEIQDAVARTRLRVERERLGLPELEARLAEMKAANRRCKIMRDDILWSDEEIDAISDDIEAFRSKLRSSTT